MTLRLRYYLMLLSLFAGFALANAALFFFIVRSEVSWSISEQSKGRAICLASFIGRELRPEDPAFKNTFPAAMARMSEVAHGLNIHWFEETAKGWESVPLFETKGIMPPPTPSAQQDEILRTGEACSLFVAQPESKTDTGIGYASVLNSKGELRAIIGVSYADSVLRNETNTTLRQCLMYCLLVTCLGLLVAEFLTRIAKQSILGLEKGAEAMTRGDYSYGWQSNRITEINDLTNTFKTISQILHEDIRQAWRRFFQAELLPRREEIAMDCQSHFDNASLLSHFGPQVVARRINGGSPDDFLGLRADKHNWRLVVGRLEPQADASDTLHQIVRANAARDFLLGCAGADSIDAVRAKVHRVFPCIQLELAKGSPESKQITRSSLTGVNTCDGETSEDRRGVMGTLSEASLSFARDYVRQNSGQPIAMIADKLAIILASSGKGILVVYDGKLRS